nr:MAG TPA: hypothetical protein [Caudoviricetes sp.]
MLALFCRAACTFFIRSRSSARCSSVSSRGAVGVPNRTSLRGTEYHLHRISPSFVRWILASLYSSGCFSHMASSLRQ